MPMAPSTLPLPTTLRNITALNSRPPTAHPLFPKSPNRLKSRLPPLTLWDRLPPASPSRGARIVPLPSPSTSVPTTSHGSTKSSILTSSASPAFTSRSIRSGAPRADIPTNSSGITASRSPPCTMFATCSSATTRPSPATACSTISAMPCARAARSSASPPTATPTASASLTWTARSSSPITSSLYCLTTWSKLEAGATESPSRSRPPTSSTRSPTITRCRFTRLLSASSSSANSSFRTRSPSAAKRAPASASAITFLKKTAFSPAS